MARRRLDWPAAGSSEMEDGEIILRDHRFGRVNRRMPIGPVRLPHDDLFWVHEGAVRLVFPELATEVTLTAPAGVLILPETLFQGATVGAFATATICHFARSGGPKGPGYLLPEPNEALHIQGMLKLAMDLARRDRKPDLPRRTRLLLALLDAFGAPPAESIADDRVASAWRQAGQNLHRMRTLSDVAALLGVSESTFRALHRAAWHTSAGKHLRELRLSRAEELITGTGKPLSEIARAVGYQHTATLIAAFKDGRGKTPGEYRRWSNPFA